MTRLFSVRRALGLALVLLFVSAVIAMAAGSSVPGTRLGRSTRAVTANTLKPSNCSAITLTTILRCPSGGGTCTGTDAAELILGSANVDTISALGGNDCILGGGGNDSIDCGTGTDVAIGGPGTDTFNANCNTQVQ